MAFQKIRVTFRYVWINAGFRVIVSRNFDFKFVRHSRNTVENLRPFTLSTRSILSGVSMTAGEGPGHVLTVHWMAVPSLSSDKKLICQWYCFVRFAVIPTVTSTLTPATNLVTELVYSLRTHSQVIMALNEKVAAKFNLSHRIRAWTTFLGLNYPKASPIDNYHIQMSLFLIGKYPWGEVEVFPVYPQFDIMSHG